MRTAAAVAVGLTALLAGAAPASAATPGLSCLRAPAPGAMTLVAGGHGTTETQLFDAGPGGATEIASTQLGDRFSCGDVASGGGTTAVGALISRGDSDVARVRVAVREGNAGFTVTDLARGSDRIYAAEPEIAVGSHGDIAVAWIEFHGEPVERGDPSAQVVVARRPAGGAFGKPQVVATLPSPYDDRNLFAGPSYATVGVDGAGATTLVWTRPQRFNPEDPDSFGSVAVYDATAPAGATFGGPRRVATRARSFQGFDLAVAADGRALLAWVDNVGVETAERTPGAASFGSPRAVAASDNGGTAEIDATLAADGSAAVGWLIDDGKRLSAGAVWRAGPGEFGAAREIWSQPEPPQIDFDEAFAKTRAAWPRTAARVRAAGSAGGGGTGWFAVAAADEDIPADPVDPAIAIAAGGRLTMTWVAPRAVGSDNLPTAWAATGTLADGLGTARRLSGNCRAATGATPLETTDGPRVAWLDDTSVLELPGFELITGGGRLHTQAPDQDAATSATPLKLTATAPTERQVVYYDQPVKLDASCDRACDLRAWVPGHGSGTAPLAGTTATLSAAGSTKLGVAGYGQITPAKPGKLGVRVRACDANGAVVADTTVAVPVARRTPPPLVHLLNVKAHRRHGRIVVSWDTDRVAKRQSFSIAVHETHQNSSSITNTETLYGVEPVRGRHYRAIIKNATAQSVVVSVSSDDPPRRRRHKTVDLTGP